MIEAIETEKCTGCGNCDFVCPADVIHMEMVAIPGPLEDLESEKWLPVIKFREHCVTCFNCELFCPEKIVDVHPTVRNRPRAW